MEITQFTNSPVGPWHLEKGRLIRFQLPVHTTFNPFQL